MVTTWHAPFDDRDVINQSTTTRCRVKSATKSCVICAQKSRQINNQNPSGAASSSAPLWRRTTPENNYNCERCTVLLGNSTQYADLSASTTSLSPFRRSTSLSSVDGWQLWHVLQIECFLPARVLVSWPVRIWSNRCSTVETRCAPWPSNCSVLKYTNHELQLKSYGKFIAYTGTSTHIIRNVPPPGV
jgi:hypothetical protein